MFRYGSSICIAVATAAMVGDAIGAATMTTASGANAAAIQSTVDSFRSSLGTLNPNVAGSLGGGRREINWDGVPDALSAPNNLPANFFNSNSPRGVVFSTPGSGFQLSANAGIAPVDFGNINAAYPAFFQPFSAQRLFTALGSNIVDVDLFVPGSTTAALTRGFGVVFTDVDTPNTTSLQFFGAGGVDLGTFFAPAGTVANESLSFLGVDFGSTLVSRVRITSGSGILSATSLDGGATDLVVMDDFIYGEPLAAAVPEPGSMALIAVGLAGVALRRRRNNAAT